MTIKSERSKEEALVFELLARAENSGGSRGPVFGEDSARPIVEKAEIEQFLNAVMRLAREHISEKQRRVRVVEADVREFGYL